MKCPNCNKQAVKDSKFCIHCGSKLENTKKVSKRDAHEITKRIIDHLEFFGYKIGEINTENNADKFLSTHNDRSNLLITVMPAIGLTAVAFYRIDEDKLNENKADFYELLNRMNVRAVISSFSLDENGSSLMCASWFPYYYSKELFANFLSAFEQDIKNGLATDGINKFT